MWAPSCARGLDLETPGAIGIESVQRGSGFSTDTRSHSFGRTLPHGAVETAGRSNRSSRTPNLNLL